MYDFYLGITYRTVGKITPDASGRQDFWNEPQMNTDLNPDLYPSHPWLKSVDVTQVRMYKSYRTVGKWI